jgi:hypothetical protein
MSIENLYSPRTMLAALKQVVTPKRFLIDTFFRVVETHETESVDIDVVKGGRKLAPFVSPRVEGKIVEKEGYKTFTYKPPYIKEKDITTAHHALIRRPGEMLYSSGMTPEGRAMEMMIETFQRFENMIARREEWMAAQLLQTGKVICVGDGIDETVDFLMADWQKPVLLSTALWSASTTATPIKNLKAWKALGTKKGKNINVAVMNSTTANWLLENTKEVVGANSVFDKNKILLGTIDPTQLQPGLSYIGNIKEIGLDIYSYDEWYDDPNAKGVVTNMLADGKVVLGSSMAYTRLHYGVIQDLDAGTMAKAARFPKQWKQQDPSARFLMLQSAPLPALHEIEAFMCATVL